MFLSHIGGVMEYKMQVSRAGASEVHKQVRFLELTKSMPEKKNFTEIAGLLYQMTAARLHLLWHGKQKHLHTSVKGGT